ncbi:hypothetical protein RintRC_6432 [Richelia intracellularis]|nr:hypothetical protein RintRC_6432 [Richelia intracellularis]
MQDTGEIVVISADGKGVVVRTSDLPANTQEGAFASSKKLNKPLTKGEKHNAKRMTTVASVYTINSFVGTHQQIVNPSDEDRKSKRPRPIGKRVWASLAKEPEKVISEACDEAIFRDQKKNKRFCALVDGNKKQLSLLQKLVKKHNLNLTIVVDIIHVIEYLWKAAFVFYSQTSTQAKASLSKRLQLILEGKSS